MSRQQERTPAGRPGSAEVIEIRVPRDDELAGDIADQAELAGLMYATNGRRVAIVPVGTPGWFRISRSINPARRSGQR